MARLYIMSLVLGILLMKYVAEDNFSEFSFDEDYANEIDEINVNEFKKTPIVGSGAGSIRTDRVPIVSEPFKSSSRYESKNGYLVCILTFLAKKIITVM